ncbi:MAG: hypothetical protein HY722_15675 [Planctomycetes bacterium]|nr:hypothetical protein [Planctomycetota bacterium]
MPYRYRWRAGGAAQVEDVMAEAMRPSVGALTTEAPDPVWDRPPGTPSHEERIAELTRRLRDADLRRDRDIVRLDSALRVHGSVLDRLLRSRLLVAGAHRRGALRWGAALVAAAGVFALLNWNLAAWDRLVRGRETRVLGALDRASAAEVEAARSREEESAADLRRLEQVLALARADRERLEAAFRELEGVQRARQEGLERYYGALLGEKDAELARLRQALER